MKTSSDDSPEPAAMPVGPLGGPLALILGGVRQNVHASISLLADLAASGPLTPMQKTLYADIMLELQDVASTIDRYAPQPRPPAVAHAASERWGAGEQSDALDDRYQDAPLPLDDRPGRDEQP